MLLSVFGRLREILGGFHYIKKNHPSLVKAYVSRGLSSRPIPCRRAA